MAYYDSISLFLETNFSELSPYDFYRLLFPVGELEKKATSYIDSEGFTQYRYDDEYDASGNRVYKYNGIAIEITDKKKKVAVERWDRNSHKKVKKEVEKPVVYRHTITDDLDEIEEMISNDYFCLMSPLSYVGKTRSAANARMCYAIVIDVDKVKMKAGRPIGLENFIFQTSILDPDKKPSTKINSQPTPTAIVSSGTGYHLYYMFEKPIPLYVENSRNLEKLKKALTTKAWHDSITDAESKKDIQQEGIYQGFRVVGTATKVGTRARAFMTGAKVSIEYLNKFVKSESRAKINFQEQLTAEEKKERARKRKASLDEAKERWPEWYHRRIEQGLPAGQFLFGRAMYDNHLARIENEASVGHRYWCIAMLAVFAVKCGIDYDELETDAYSLKQTFDNLTADETNRFTDEDIAAALEYYQDIYHRITREHVVERTAIEYKKQKRNFQNQHTHLWGDVWNVRREDEEGNVSWKRQINICKGNRELGYSDAVKKGKVGRPPKHKEKIEKYIEDHPDATPTEIARELKISRTTVYKWMKIKKGTQN